MKTLLLSILFATTLTSNLKAQSTTILSPTNGQVYYNGDTMEIKWRCASNQWSETVWISLNMTGTDQGSWVAADTANTGSYNWTVMNRNLGHTNFTLVIYDNYYDSIPVSIVIINGTRPITPVQVPISIHRVVSIEWLANTNHTYQIQGSANLKNWQALFEGQMPTTNAMVLFYADAENQFFRALDMTP